MLTLSQLQNGILEIARKHLGDAVKRVKVAEDADLDGKDSLRITIVVRSGDIKLSGTNLGKIKIDVIDFLQAKGDQRFPYTHYATEAELRSLARTA